jgi:hypothetical protein
VTPTTAFPHDHSPRWERCIDIDGQSVSYGDQAAWLGIASLNGFPATVAPIERTAWDRGFADSLLEGDGFELPVPRQISNALRRPR